MLGGVRSSPRLPCGVVKGVGLHAVAILTAERVPIDEPETGERRVGQEAMLQAELMRGVDPAGEDRIQDVLLGEVEGVLEPQLRSRSPCRPRVPEVDEGRLGREVHSLLSLAEHREDAAPELAWEQHDTVGDVWLFPQRVELQHVGPRGLEARPGVDEGDHPLVADGALHEIGEAPCRDDVGVDRDNELGRVQERRVISQEDRRARRRRRDELHVGGEGLSFARARGRSRGRTPAHGGRPSEAS